MVSTAFVLLVLAAAGMAALATALLWLDRLSIVHRVFAAFLGFRAMNLGVAALMQNADEVSDAALFAYGLRLVPYFAIGGFMMAAWFLMVYPRPLFSPPVNGRVGRGLLALTVIFEATYFVWHAAAWRFRIIDNGPGQMLGVEIFDRQALSLLNYGSSPLFATVGLVFLWRYLHAGTVTPRRSLLLVATGFLLNGMFDAASRATTLVSRLAGDQSTGPLLENGAWIASIVPALTVVPAAASVFLLLGAWRRHPATGTRNAARNLLLVSALPLLNGILHGWIVATGFLFALGLSSSLIAIWRTLLPALAAWALVRHQLFEVDLRVGKGLVLAFGGAALALAAWTGASVATAVGLAPVWMSVGSGLVVAAVAFAWPPLRAGPGQLAARAVGSPANKSEFLERRRLEVYRDQLVRALDEHWGEDNSNAFLIDLRKQLGLSDEVDKALRLMIRADAGAQAPSETRKRFRVVRELGRGGFAVAELARDLRLNRHVVLKKPFHPWLLEPEGRAAFLQEAQLAAQVQHPNVVVVHEIMDDADPPALVLEYVPGGNLQASIDRRAPIPVGEALGYFEDLVAGLGAIHAAGIVHRDIKPANVMLDDSGRAKVGDFGVAKAPVEFPAQVTLAIEGFQPGTVAYMSPEQAQGAAVDHRSDLYSAAVIMYNLVATRPLHRRAPAGSREEFRLLVGRGPPEDHLQRVPAETHALFGRALAVEPAQRFQDAKHLLAEIRRLHAELHGPAARAGSHEQTVTA